MMRACLEEARISFQEGNKGFGALVALGGEILARAHDTDVSEGDPTAHAETKAIRLAAKRRGSDLSGCLVVSTHEPCPMCAGAMVWAGIGELAYGQSIQDSLAAGRHMIDLSCREIFTRAGVDVLVSEGVLATECGRLYDPAVREAVGMLRAGMASGWAVLEGQIASRRLSWVDRHTDVLAGLSGSDVEKAYALLLAKIGVNEREAPVVERSQKRIVFRSRNFCPTLEACLLLDLDTREVCRAVYEKPTEMLIRAVNPNLRFSRNYDQIRPLCDYCEETIWLE